MTCYFGAWCIVRSGLATCECKAAECPALETPSVCGSDGRTYLSACHLRAHSCRTQSDVVTQAFGPCSDVTPQVRRGSRSLDKTKFANAANNPVVRTASSSSDKPISSIKRRSAFISNRSHSFDKGSNRSSTTRRFNVKFVDDVTRTSKTSHNLESAEDHTEKHLVKSDNADMTCVDILPPVGYR